MRWLRGLVMLVSTLSVTLWGCGSDSFGGTGQGTLQLMRFESGVDDQPDFVSSTGSQIDVCIDLCTGTGGSGEVMIEPFSSTQAAAIVMNRGKSDITVDRIGISYPNSGLADSNIAVAGGFAIPGGRCSNNSSLACASSIDCNGDLCVNSESAVPFTLLTLDRKELIGGPNCVNGFTPDVIETFVTISGRDVEGERYTISGGMNLEVANYDNCEDTN